jgi:hypothetical protein
MDNTGSGQGPVDGSFNPSGPGPASQQATVIASSEPPSSTPTTGPSSQQVAQSNNPSLSISPSSPGPGPGQRQESGSKSGGGNLSLAMSVVSRVQAADRATQTIAVANAQQVVTTSSASAQAQANQVVEQANALSSDSSQASQTLTSTTMQQGTRQQQGGTGVSVMTLQGPSVMTLQALTSSASSSQTVTVDTTNIQRVDGVGDSSIYSLTSNSIQRYSPGVSLNSQFNGVAISSAPIQMIQPRQEFKFESRIEQESQSFQTPQTATTRGTVLNDIIEQRVNVASFQMEQQMDTVKKNVLPNELAGSVDIAAMAMTPKGYEVYSIVTLRDVPFYKPEAIYKDNKTVDNARVLRGLTSGSDAKHQEMVNQQYK